MAVTTGPWAGLSIETLKEYRTKAQNALFALQTGAQVIEVDYAERRFRYAKADAHKLEAMIAQFTALIEGRKPRGPVYIGKIGS